MTDGPAPEFVAALMSLATSVLAPVNEAIDGYRADLLRRGYSPPAAEQMAVEYHNLLFAQLMHALLT